MSPLVKIEHAAARLSAREQQQLLLFLAAALRAKPGEMPEPRRFSREQIAAWIADDEAEMQRFREDCG